MSNITKPMNSHVLLIGGGHAHVAVLADWAENGLPCDRATLLTPHRYLRYSGMVPGWIAGEHSRDAGRVDLEALAKAAGVKLVLDRCVALDPNARSILSQANGALSFDVASIDTGGVGRAKRTLGDDPRLLDVRPIEVFVDEIERRMEETRDHPLKIAVIGGGAGGFEIAFGLRNSAHQVEKPDITMIFGEAGPLPGFSRALKERAVAALKAQGIAYSEGEASFADGKLLADGRSIEPQDIIIAAIGSGAPDWPGASGLAVDRAGFIAVDAHQRSISHEHIFAAGDVASRTDCHVPHSGVHAVHTGPVLAANLRHMMTGEGKLRSYRPRPASLYLISTGQGRAIASYGPLVAKARWVSRLKAWIDKRGIARYADLSGTH